MKRLWVLWIDDVANVRVRAFTGRESWDEVLPESYGLDVVLAVAATKEEAEMLGKKMVRDGADGVRLSWERPVKKQRGSLAVDFGQEQPAPEVLT